MKPLIYLTIFTFFASALNCSAQQFKISWEDVSKKKWEYEDAIELTSGNSLVIKYDVKPATVFNSASPDPTFMLADPDMKILKEKKYQVGENNAREVRMRKIGSNIYLTYYTYEKGQVYFFATKIEPETLTFEARKTFGPFNSSYPSPGDIDLKFSSDSSKLLLFVEGPVQRKENKQFYIGVYDTDLKRIWSRNVEFPIGSLYMIAENYDILNDGKVSVALKHFEKAVSYQSVKEKTAKIPPYTYKIQIYSQQGPAKEITFDVQSNFIEGTRLIQDKNGMITVAGLYKKKHNGNITGTFYTRFDASVSEVKNIKMLNFPDELLKLVDKDDQGKSDGSDPGIYTYLRMKDIMQRENGSVDLISELHRVYTTTEIRSGSAYNKETVNYVYGDIININLDKNGNALFTRIPKRQEASKADYGLGYFPVVQGNKLVLLYNDDRENVTRDLSKSPEHYASVRKCVLVAATIDEKGNLTREAIYDFKDEKRMALPRYSMQVSDHKLRLISLSAAFLSARRGLGTLEIL